MVLSLQGVGTLNLMLELLGLVSTPVKMKDGDCSYLSCHNSQVKLCFLKRKERKEERQAYYDSVYTIPPLRITISSSPIYKWYFANNVMVYCSYCSLSFVTHFDY